MAAATWEDHGTTRSEGESRSGFYVGSMRASRNSPSTWTPWYLANTPECPSRHQNVCQINLGKCTVFFPPEDCDMLKETGVWHPGPQVQVKQQQRSACIHGSLTALLLGLGVLDWRGWVLSGARA